MSRELSNMTGEQNRHQQRGGLPRPNQAAMRTELSGGRLRSRLRAGVVGRLPLDRWRCGTVYPGCAAALRPWALECNRFAVKNQATAMDERHLREKRFTALPCRGGGTTEGNLFGKCSLQHFNLAQWRCPTKRPQLLHRRSGFVLLMSLMLIALVGIMLVGLARQRLIIAAETHEATFDLQRRWGTVFLSRLLLSDPERLISRLEVPQRQLPMTETLQFGELTFRVTLDDENRKLNINRLQVAGGTEQLLQTIHRLSGGGTRIELKPAHGSVLGVRKFNSWGHVVNLVPSSEAERQFDQMDQLSQVMTCWGDTRVNIHRCSDAVLLRVGILAAGPVPANRLVALRESEPQLSTDPLLNKLAVNRRKRALLKGWLTDHSGCYSLWILAGDRRSLLDLFVRENSGSESHSIKRFRW